MRGARFNVVSVVASGCLEVSRIGEFKDFKLTEKNVEDLIATGVILRDVMLVSPGPQRVQLEGRSRCFAEERRSGGN